MSDHVFVISEWLPTVGCEQKLWNYFNELVKLTLQNEQGCIRAHAMKQIPHPGAPSESKFTIVLQQEYVDVDAFNIHCDSEYVKKAFEECIGNEDTALVADWQCRLFSENG